MTRAFAELAGLVVVSGSVCLPRVGRWHARLSLDSETAPLGLVTLSLAEGATKLEGAVYRGHAHAGRVDLLVVGGTGGLDKPITPKAYRDVPARIPLADLLGECGETLAASSDAAVTGAQMARWTRAPGLASGALHDLVNVLGASWRMTDDGTVWVGAEAWPATRARVEVLDEMPSEGALVLADEACALRPGETLDGRRIDYLELTITADAVRTTAWVTA